MVAASLTLSWKFRLESDSVPLAVSVRAHEHTDCVCTSGSRRSTKSYFEPVSVYGIKTIQLPREPCLGADADI